MIIRSATIRDIPQMQRIRNSVLENRLSNPELISHRDYENYISIRGKGWVCVSNGLLVGFAVVDLQVNNIWALFVDPEHEGTGIGTALHQTMLNWYFSQTETDVWLSTAPATRAEKFYRKIGWKEAGMYGKGEIKFVMRFDDWTKRIEQSR